MVNAIESVLIEKLNHYYHGHSDMIVFMCLIWF